jgi:hypothetical protein
VDSTFLVLLCLGMRLYVWPAAQTFELLSSPFGATVRVRRMSLHTKHVALGVAGTLILQLVLIASAQETVPSIASAPVFSAPPAGKVAAAESSQSQDRSDTGTSPAVRSHDPERRMAREIPHSEGNATRFTGSRNPIPWM